MVRELECPHDWSHATSLDVSIAEIGAFQVEIASDLAWPGLDCQPTVAGGRGFHILPGSETSTIPPHKVSSSCLRRWLNHPHSILISQ